MSEDFGKDLPALADPADKAGRGQPDQRDHQAPTRETRLGSISLW
jgi:hypothetical protein